ncbi:MAG: Fic family protein, partial [Rhodoglobus sp.]
VDGYHASLTAYRAGNIEPIVAQFAEASLRAVVNARELVSDIDDIVARWRDRITARSDSGVWRILDIVARTPVIDADLVATELGIRPQNVYSLLRYLTEHGVLNAKTEHRYGTLWRSDEILHAIDRFAERAGRRSPSKD